MPGTFYPPPRVSDPDLHHGPCVTHVPWCRQDPLASGFLWSRWWGKSSRHSRRKWKPQFYVSVEWLMTSPLISPHQVVLSIGVSWLVCFVLTVCDVLPDDPESWGYGARTDIRTHALREAPWFRVPYPCTYSSRACLYGGHCLWGSLPDEIRSLQLIVLVTSHHNFWSWIQRYLPLFCFWCILATYKHWY